MQCNGLFLQRVGHGRLHPSKHEQIFFWSCPDRMSYFGVYQMVGIPHRWSFIECNIRQHCRLHHSKHGPTPLTPLTSPIQQMKDKHLVNLPIMSEPLRQKGKKKKKPLQTGLPRHTDQLKYTEACYMADQSKFISRHVQHTHYLSQSWLLAFSMTKPTKLVI